MCGDWDTVLVVDDDPACRDLHSIWLDDEYEVLTAADGTAAVEQVGAADVMLLDREMPRMDGEAVARHVHDSNADCFVVMLSGVEPDFDILELPVDEYLTKPLTKSELRETVNELQLRSQLDDELQRYFRLTSKIVAIETSSTAGTEAALEDLRSEVSRLRGQIQERIDELNGFDPAFRTIE